MAIPIPMIPRFAAYVVAAIKHLSKGHAPELRYSKECRSFHFHGEATFLFAPRDLRGRFSIDCVCCPCLTEQIGDAVLLQRPLNRGDGLWIGLNVAAGWQIVVGCAFVTDSRRWHYRMARRAPAVEAARPAARDKLAAAQRDQVFEKGCGQRRPDAGVGHDQALTVNFQLVDWVVADLGAQVIDRPGAVCTAGLLDSILEEAQYAVFGNVHWPMKEVWLDERPARAVIFEYREWLLHALHHLPPTLHHRRKMPLRIKGHTLPSAPHLSGYLPDLAPSRRFRGCRSFIGPVPPLLLMSSVKLLADSVA